MKLGLAFSAGKDSWACLYLFERQLKDVHVLWVNTGKAYPETLAMIEKARAMCPNFHEIRVDRDANDAIYGLPSDVVPVDYTALGQVYTGPKPVTVQPYHECCQRNIGIPLHEKCLELGITHLIRGQRDDESHRSPARHGDIVDGIMLIQPLERWTEKQVMTYLRSKMEIPAHFAIKHSSLDCYDCTGFWKDSKDRIEYTKTKHPILWMKLEDRRIQLAKALQETMGDFGVQ